MAVHNSLLDKGTVERIRTVSIAIALVAMSLHAILIDHRPLSFIIALVLVCSGAFLLSSTPRALIEMGAISAAVALSGGYGSPYLSLYLVLTIGIALSLPLDRAMAISIVGGLAHCIQLYLLTGAPVPHLIAQGLSIASSLVVITYGCHFLLARASQEFLKAQAEFDTNKRELLDAVSDPIVIIDINQVVLLANLAAENLFGKDLLARSLDQIQIQQGMKKTDPQTLRMIKSGKVETYQLVRGEQDQKGFTTITFKNITELTTVEAQLASHERLATLLAASKKVGDLKTDFLSSFAGQSPVMKKVVQLITKVAPTEATVLIQGESGTGKELVARAIHNCSQVGSGPFVPVNCGAIPADLLESELFGHMKGSYTGASRDTLGLIREADGGTLFLDEVGELPLLLQVKLLRFIQERTVRPVGGTKDIPVQVRIVSATNRNLRDEVSANRFREDLYYRLHVITVSLPPLRERKEDLPELVSQLLNRISPEHESMISPQAMSALEKYDYPGNVRELENILERAVVLGDGIILPEHLPESLLQGRPTKGSTSVTETQILVDETVSFPVNLEQILTNVEVSYIKAALAQADGSKTKAAELLGVNFRSFRYRVQKLGL